MTITNQQAEKLLLGKYIFAHLNFSMLLMRLKILYAKDPSQDTLQTCAKEIGVFLDKFKNTMSTDFALIQKL